MNLLGGGILLILGGGAIALLLRNHSRLADTAFRTLMLAGCTVTAIPAVRLLVDGRNLAVSLSSTLPGGPWVAGLDHLSAWFITLLCLVGGATATYGVRYLVSERPHRDVTACHAVFALLVASMLGVFLARAVVPFLVAWELMAVSAYLLIVFDHDHAGVRRAGMVYLVLTHAGTLGLLGMFLVWGRSSADLSFANLTPAAAHLVWGGAPILLLAIFGFGVKAGVFPFHFWLPGAHAAAPSHVSALLSGVMIKTGVYGLLRVLTLFGAPPAWWAWTVLLLGLASALCGVLWALTQQDLKRALAYSSVDNIGVILLGLGLGALGSAYHHPALALLGFTGALLHTLNHALFKSLLFLGAGAVVRATGTREIDRLGGLVRVMPRTAGAFLLGSIAIIGLPPLNGFLGEWTLVRGFLTAGGGSGPIRFAALGSAAIGLIGALTLACFLRLGTAVFLGKARSETIEPNDDAPGGIGFGLALLTAGCLTIGLVPALALGPALRVAAPLSVDAGSLALDPSLGGAATTAITTLVAGLVLLCAVFWGIRFVAGRGLPIRVNATWGCAYAAPTPRMQYTAASFGASLAGAFSASAPPAMGRGPRGFDPSREDRVLGSIAVPTWERLRRSALRLRPLQQGRVTTYLQYIIGSVLLLLGFLFLAGFTSPP